MLPRKSLKMGFGFFSNVLSSNNTNAVTANVILSGTKVKITAIVLYTTAFGFPGIFRVL